MQKTTAKQRKAEARAKQRFIHVSVFPAPEGWRRNNEPYRRPGRSQKPARIGRAIGLSGKSGVRLAKQARRRARAVAARGNP